MPGVRRMSTADAVRTIVLGVGLFNLLLYQQELLQAAGPGVARVDLLWAEQHPAEPPSAAPPVPSYKLGLPPGVPPAAAYGLLPRQGGAGESSREETREVRAAPEHGGGAAGTEQGPALGGP